MMTYDYQNKYVYPPRDQHRRDRYPRHPRRDFPRGINPWDRGGRCPHSRCPYDGYYRDYERPRDFNRWYDR